MGPDLLHLPAPSPSASWGRAGGGRWTPAGLTHQHTFLICKLNKYFSHLIALIHNLPQLTPTLKTPGLSAYPFLPAPTWGCSGVPGCLASLP